VKSSQAALLSAIFSTHQVAEVISLSAIIVLVVARLVNQVILSESSINTELVCTHKAPQSHLTIALSVKALHEVTHVDQLFSSVQAEPSRVKLIFSQAHKTIPFIVIELVEVSLFIILNLLISVVTVGVCSV
jgi:hypothetical protein